LSLFLTQLFPHAVIIVPLFVIFRRLNLYDTFGALILANMVFALPVAIWLVIGFFDGIPDELMDAALIDGSTRIGVLFRIILPISYTGLVATFMYIFIGVWSELLFAVTFTTRREVRVLPLRYLTLLAVHHRLERPPGCVNAYCSPCRHHLPALAALLHCRHD